MDLRMPPPDADVDAEEKLFVARPGVTFRRLDGGDGERNKPSGFLNTGRALPVLSSDCWLRDWLRDWLSEGLDTAAAGGADADGVEICEAPDNVRVRSAGAFKPFGRLMLLAWLP